MQTHSDRLSTLNIYQTLRAGGGVQQSYLGWGCVLHSVGPRLLGRRTHGDSLEVVMHPDGQGALNVVLHGGRPETRK